MAPEVRGREFRVDFSARHLDVDADLGELSLSGDVVVTVGRYRLAGHKVRLQRGPRGIRVEGDADIAFCSCDKPPVTLSYSSVTLAPPSDVLVENAVLRAGGVPLIWLPYLWLRSPDRLGLIFPTVEWRGGDGLLIGSGLHVPFEANQGRPAARALDIGAYAYLNGGARIDVRLLTPQSTSLARWDYLDGSALGIEAHAAASGETAAVWAYDVDVSRGPRGRSSLSSLEAAARPYDHARIGAGSLAGPLLALGAAVDARRGGGLTQPLDTGPFAVVATSGSLGRATSYSVDLGAGSWMTTGQSRDRGGETRALERVALESAQALGPLLVRQALFEHGELVALPAQAVSKLGAGAALSLALPLQRQFGPVSHVVSPQVLARVERRYWDADASSFVLGSAGVHTALGRPARGGATSLWLGAALAGDPGDLHPVTESAWSADTRWLGLRVSGVAEPLTRDAEATARLRLGARGGTTLAAYAEARTETAPALASEQTGGDLLPSFLAGGGYDRAGLSSGAELTLDLLGVGSGEQPIAQVGGGIDLDPLEEKVLGLRGFGRYRHACGCFAVAAFGSSRTGRAGFDAGIALDLMP